MSETFDFSRWCLLVKKHWVENQKRYLLSLLMIPGLLVGWYVFILLNKGHHPLPMYMQYSTYEVGLYILGCFYASTMFSDLGSISKGINFLSVPASQLEKLICAIFYAVILFFVVYTVEFYVVNIPFVKLGNFIGYERFVSDHFANEVYRREEIINIFKFNFDPTFYVEGFIYIFVIYFPVQSAFLLGSVYFPRFAFVKTAIAILVIWLMAFVFLFKILHLLVPMGWDWESLAQWSHIDKIGRMNLVTLPGWLLYIVSVLVKFSIPVILWIATYFRLKEKEI